MLTEDMFIMDTCKSTPGFEFYPRFSKKIDVLMLSKELQKKGYYLDKDGSPFFIDVNSSNGKLTIFNSLKILIKDQISEDTARILLKDVLSAINTILKD